MKIAVWNIGHYSDGNSPKSAVTEEVLEEKKARFRAYIYDEVKADTFCLCEYTAMFCNSDTLFKLGPVFAKDVLFDEYPASYEGAQHRYSANAVFAKADIGLSDTRRKVFACNKDAEILHTDLIRASDYYYLKGTVVIDGAPVTLIVCHLAFDMKRDPDTVNLAQLHELIDALKEEKRVVIAGDFNCRDFGAFDLFRKAGYTLANDGSLITCPAASSNKALDNILVKGLSVSNVRVHETDLSDHHAISADVALA